MDRTTFHSLEIFSIAEGVWKATITVYSECCGKREKKSKIIKQKKKPTLNEIRDKWDKL